MKHTKLLCLCLSLLLGAVGTFTYAGDVRKAGPRQTQQLAWWGGVYPGYCLPDAMELVQGKELSGKTREIPVKIGFKYLTFLSQSGK